MNYELEIKKCMLQKDIHNLQAAEFEQRKFQLEAMKRASEAGLRMAEYSAQIKKKQAEIDDIELAAMEECHE